MKRRISSAAVIVLFFVGIVLILLGIGTGMHFFSQLEQLSMDHVDHGELLKDIRRGMVYTVFAGGIVVAGIGLMVIVILHLFRKTSILSKETDLLKQKNDAIEALNEKTRQLSHHQRLETIGILTSSIAHEFNNLLTPIMGYSLMALEKLPQDSELYDDMLEIYESSRQAKDIISRLNDLSRKNSGSAFRLASPDDLIRKTITVANPAKPDGVEIRLDLNCWDQRIHVNEIQFSQMILNLILNAFHAMEQGGVLSVNTSFDEDHIHIRLGDTGCGMTDEVKAKIFEPFFTTKETGRGTGLGLAIVAQVVEDHHGRIDVESEVGKGTVFHVSLRRDIIHNDENINNY